MKKIKVGVIGGGFIGPVHVESLRRLGYLDVVAIATTNTAGAQALAQKLCIPKGYGDYTEPVSYTHLGAQSDADATPPWISGGASGDDGMTSGQEQDFVKGFTGQGDADTDFAPHTPASGKGGGKDAPDAGKGPSPGYESDTAEDLGNVIEVETGGKPQAEAGDYGGQEGGNPSQGGQQNTPQEEASPHAQGGQRKIETAPLELSLIHI